MGLLDSIEKLITEHGSAAILRERISLANDQYSALEQRNAELQADNAALKAEQESLRAEVERLRLHNEKLTQQQATQPNLRVAGHTEPLEEIRENILVALAGASEMMADRIALNLKVSDALATFHLEELKLAKLVSAQCFVAGMGYDSVTEWSISQAGRAYLFKRGLLK